MMLSNPKPAPVAEYISNMLCRVDKVINPWVVFAECVTTGKTFRIALKEAYPLDSTFLGEALYFDGQIDYPTLQVMFATCYRRDKNGCVNFINKKGL